MSTSQRPAPAQPDEPGDLTFVAHDLGRDEMGGDAEPAPLAFSPGAQASAAVAHSRFHVAGPAPGRARPGTADQLPWTTRDRRPPEPGGGTDSAWTVRRTDQWRRTSETTLRRLRQEAVNLSWTAAWLAIGAAGPPGRKRRRR